MVVHHDSSPVVPSGNATVNWSGRGPVLARPITDYNKHRFMQWISRGLKSIEEDEPNDHSSRSDDRFYRFQLNKVETGGECKSEAESPEAVVNCGLIIHLCVLEVARSHTLY